MPRFISRRAICVYAVLCFIYLILAALLLYATLFASAAPRLRRRAAACFSIITTSLVGHLYAFNSHAAIIAPPHITPGRYAIDYH